MKILPTKPSELIRLALADLAKVARDSRYKINMRVWHAPTNEVCAVCLAGAVMACSLDVTPNQRLSPGSFSVNENQLRALDNFRCGDVMWGLMSLGYLPEDAESIAKKIGDLDIVCYEEDPTKFRRQMFGLARRLENLGL